MKEMLKYISVDLIFGFNESINGTTVTIHVL